MKLALVLALILVLLVSIAPALAQDVTETPAPPPAEENPTPPDEGQPGFITLEQAAALLLSALVAIVAGGAGQAPITTFLVSLAKYIPALKDVSGQVLQVVIGGVITILFWIAARYNFEPALRSWIDFLLVVGPAVLNLLVAYGMSSVYHHSAVAMRAPVFGFQRTK